MHKVTLELSCIEIYNDSLKDLLAVNNEQQQKDLVVSFTGGRVKVNNLSSRRIENLQESLEVMS